jgi:hypothetical protein
MKLFLTMERGWRRSHDDMPMAISLDPMWQASQVWVIENLVPAFEVERSLSF